MELRTNRLATAILAVMRRRGERGASAVEYGLMVAGIAALIVASVWVLGAVVHGFFGVSATCVNWDTAHSCPLTQH